MWNRCAIAIQVAPDTARVLPNRINRNAGRRITFRRACSGGSGICRNCLCDSCCRFLYERTDGFLQALSDLQHRAGSISLIMTAVGTGIALVTLVTMMVAFFCRGGGPFGGRGGGGYAHMEMIQSISGSVGDGEGLVM